MLVNVRAREGSRELDRVGGQRRGGRVRRRERGVDLARSVAPPTVRVLVVDDHDVVRAGLRLLLGGYDDVECVGDAADGQQAVDMVGTVHPDVVLMDINMPVLDWIAFRGIHVLKRIFLNDTAELCNLNI